MPTTPRLAIRACLLALVCAAADLGAQSLSTPVTATFVVGSETRLTLSQTAISFPDADPDLMALVPSAEGPITVTAKGRPPQGSTMVLTIQASDDLRSGTDVIATSALTWTATGTGFVGGTVSKTTAQTVASWSTGGAFSGTLTFLFRNSWTYPIGTYNVTLVYSLSTP